MNVPPRKRWADAAPPEAASTAPLQDDVEGKDSVEAPKKKKKKTKEKINCICGSRRPGDWIQCDECNTWYHQECVNLDFAIVDTLDVWKCPPCSGTAGTPKASSTKKSQPTVTKCKSRGCTKPAHPGSKYCTPGCGESEMARFLQQLMRKYHLKLSDLVENRQGKAKQCPACATKVGMDEDSVLIEGNTWHRLCHERAQSEPSKGSLTSEAPKEKAADAEDPDSLSQFNVNNLFNLQYSPAVFVNENIEALLGVVLQTPVDPDALSKEDAAECERIRAEAARLQTRIAEIQCGDREADSIVETSRTMPVPEGEEDTAENFIGDVFDCVSCGHPISSKTWAQHMEKCFQRKEGSFVMCGEPQPGRCNFHDPDIPSYCTIMAGSCPYHPKRTKGLDNPPYACGYPLAPGVHCTRTKKACLRHLDWENLLYARNAHARLKLIQAILALREQHRLLLRKYQQRSKPVAA